MNVFISFHFGGDPPGRAPCILHASTFVRVFLLHRFLHRCRSSFQGAPICRVNVAHETWTQTVATAYRCHGEITTVSSTEPRRIAFRQPPKQFNRAKDALEKLMVRLPIDNQIRRDGAIVVWFENWS
jgi:hypothetical protein